jgi:hypothetical protein
METNFTPKNAVFVCLLCDFKCSKNSDMNRHTDTIKHIRRVDGNKMDKMDTNFTPYNKCNCGKEFLTRGGLWKHNKKCKKEDFNEIQGSKNSEVQELKEFMKYLMKENSEMKNIMLEVIKNGTSITSITNNNTTNSNNKSFNLQFFLNETCKDAMNITDFVDSIKLQLSDLERVGELGYIEGISSIIIKNLNALDVTLRPVHCTDKKRETMYIKDQDKWEKEDMNKATLHKMVRKIANKNISLIKDYKERYPDCTKSTSKYSNKYNKIVIESMGCSGETSEFEKEEKIIKRVVKEVILDKLL